MLLLSLLIALLLLVLLGFYVVVGAPRSRAHQTFALFVASLALWTVKDIMFWGFGPLESLGGIWAGLSFIIALFLQYSLSVFSWVFPDDRPIPAKRLFVLFSPGVILIPAVLSGLMWTHAGVSEGRFGITLTPLAYAFGIYIYGLFCYGFATLFRKYLSLRGTLKGQQLGAVLWALIITVALMTLANVALPLVGVYSLLSISSVFVLPGVLIYAYAITSFKLFSLQSALDQFRLFPVAYKVALSIAVVAVLSFVALQVPIVWWAFGAGPAADSWKRYLVVSVISALFPNLILVALVVRVISRPVRKLTEAAVKVAGGEYGTMVDLSSNDEIGLLASSFNEMSRKMASDIEKLRQLNEQLIRTERLAATGALAAGVAHEVNNPLASISSLIQIIQAKSDTSTETREMLRLVTTQIERITRVLRDMMNFARVRPASRRLLDINLVLERTVRLAGFDKRFKTLSVETSFDNGIPKVEADADQLEQVFLNLLLNARDAMPEGGLIRISTGCAEVRDAVAVTVIDDGPGISREDLKRIFDPFFTTKSDASGTGLGLAVCYGIVTAHGGTISIDSHVGQGTIVKVTIPTGQRNSDMDLETSNEPEQHIQISA